MLNFYLELLAFFLIKKHQQDMNFVDVFQFNIELYKFGDFDGVTTFTRTLF